MAHTKYSIKQLASETTRVATLSSLSFAISYADAMINGQKTNKDYQAVGSIIATDAQEAFCTATLISPEWIVLAGHCNEGGSEDDPITYEAEQLTFQVGSNARKPELQVKLSKWIQPKLKTEGSEEEIYLDMAFAKLSQPIGKINDKTISPIPLSLADINTQLDKEFEVVGFGYTEPIGYGSKNGTRLKANYSVTSTRGNALLKLFDNLENFTKYLSIAHPGEEEVAERHLNRTEHLIENYQAHAWDPTQRENGKFQERPAQGWANSCNGDSGGPLLIKEENSLRVAGIIQGGFNGDNLGCVELGSIIGLFGPEVIKVIRENNIPAIGLSKE